MSSEKLIVVYQLGKVGSTSIVASLNRIHGVEAHQCHFLGERAYNGIIRSCLRKDVGEYFFEHSIGQLLMNIRVERAMLTRERDGRRSYILSLSRHPIDWFQSALQQDLRGTITTIVSFAEGRGHAGRPLAHAIEVLREEIRQLFRLSNEVANRERRVAELLGAQTSRFREDYGEFSSFIIQQLRVFLRPFTWFADHFEEFTKQTVVLDANKEFHAADERRFYMVVRYEDIDKLPHLLRERWGVAIEQLETKNVSAAKPGADRVNELIQSWRSDEELMKLISGTSYCVTFGYHEQAE